MCAYRPACGAGARAQSAAPRGALARCQRQQDHGLIHGVTRAVVHAFVTDGRESPAMFSFPRLCI
jgi:hypothetical protein